MSISQSFHEKKDGYVGISSDQNRSNLPAHVLTFFPKRETVSRFAEYSTQSARSHLDVQNGAFVSRARRSTWILTPLCLFFHTAALLFVLTLSAQTGLENSFPTCTRHNQVRHVKRTHRGILSTSCIPLQSVGDKIQIDRKQPYEGSHNSPRAALPLASCAYRTPIYAVGAR